MAFTCEKARNQLNLKTVIKQDISVKCFGNNEKMKKKLDRVQFTWKELMQKVCMLVRTCLNSQKIEVAKQRYDNFKEIKLSDRNPYISDPEMYVLIARDFSGNFICDSFVWGDSGPTVLLTKVEYVLSRPIEEGTVFI